MLTAKPFGHEQLYVISGPVGAGKTLHVEQFLDRLVDSNYRSNGNVVVVRHPADDSSPNTIGRHSVQVTASVDEIIQRLSIHTETVIVVGASHYTDHNIVCFADAVVRSGRKMVVSGLNLDVNGQPHGFMPQLMALAHHVEVMKSICYCCDDENASRSVQIEGHYFPSCTHHAMHPDAPPIAAGKGGSLSLYLGPMFAGKSTKWSRKIEKLRVAGRDPIVFKYLGDTRDGSSGSKVYDTGEVTIHSGKREQAICVSNAEQMSAYLRDFPKQKDIALDEGQFIHGLYNLVLSSLGKGYRFHITGLPRGFNRSPFGDIPKLMCLADVIEMNYAMCVYENGSGRCGRPATENQRLKRGADGVVGVAHANDPLELIGGKDKDGASYFYEARCLQHWKLEGEDLRKYSFRRFASDTFG